MLGRPTTLNIYWGDDCTIEVRYFKSERKARKYIKDNGIVKYEIEPTYWNYAYDKVGRVIKVGDMVEWHGPDPQGVGKIIYKVFDVLPEMVRMANDYGECEALPEECKVIVR